MTGSDATPPFRVAYVPGVTPGKWVRIWNERLPDVPLTLVTVTAAQAPDVLRDGGADAGFVRLPVDRTYFSAIPLYTETTVVVVPKDHVVTAVDEVAMEDLADEVVLHPLDDTLGWERPPGKPALERPAGTGDAVELVAAGVGLLVVPQSLARLHHRKDLTYRPLTDAPQSQVALAWPQEATTDRVEDFIGIVRGRTVNSTRGRAAAQPQQAEQTKQNKLARQAKQRSAGGSGGGQRGAAGSRAAGRNGKSPRPGPGGRPRGGKRGGPRRRS